LIYIDLKQQRFEKAVDMLKPPMLQPQLHPALFIRILDRYRERVLGQRVRSSWIPVTLSWHETFVVLSSIMKWFMIVWFCCFYTARNEN